MAYDPTKIHRIKFSGKYHKMDAFHQTHPSPQRTPVIFQAGASKSGVEFAGKHAEGIYTDSGFFLIQDSFGNYNTLVPQTCHILAIQNFRSARDTYSYSRVDFPMIKSNPEFLLVGSKELLSSHVQAVRAEAIKQGRDPATIKVFAAILPILGRTVEEAKAKHETAKGFKSPEASLAKFGAYTGIDMSAYPLDEPFDFEGKTGGANTITGVIKAMKTMIDSLKINEGPVTPRMLGDKLALGGAIPMPIGTAEMVADVFEEWWRETDIDGFNIVCELRETASVIDWDELTTM